MLMYNMYNNNDASREIRMSTFYKDYQNKRVSNGERKFFKEN